MSRRILIVFALCCVIACTGCSNISKELGINVVKTHNVDLNLYALMFFDHDDDAKELQLSVKGTITDNLVNDDDLNIEFQFPNDFAYKIITKNSLLSNSQRIYGVDYFVCNTYSVITEDGGLEPVSIYLDLQQGLLAVYWRNGDLLLASTAQDFDKDQVMEHFSLLFGS